MYKVHKLALIVLYLTIPGKDELIDLCMYCHVNDYQPIKGHNRINMEIRDKNREETMDYKFSKNTLHLLFACNLEDKS